MLTDCVYFKIWGWNASHISRLVFFFLYIYRDCGSHNTLPDFTKHLTFFCRTMCNTYNCPRSIIVCGFLPDVPETRSTRFGVPKLSVMCVSACPVMASIVIHPSTTGPSNTKACVYSNFHCPSNSLSLSWGQWGLQCPPGGQHWLTPLCF